MPIPKDIDLETIHRLIADYDEYIQLANDEDKYRSGWQPVCINEFYDNEFLLNEEARDLPETFQESFKTEKEAQEFYHSLDNSKFKMMIFMGKGEKPWLVNYNKD